MPLMGKTAFQGQETGSSCWTLKKSSWEMGFAPLQGPLIRLIRFVRTATTHASPSQTFRLHVPLCP